MNRSRLAQLLGLVAVLGGAGYVAIYAPDPGVTALDLADAGIAGPNRVATCPVRVDPSCAEALGVRRYETVRFPVFRSVLPDGGVEFVLPPGIRGAARCIEVLNDWADCDLDPVASFPVVAARWSAPVPLALARQASRFVVPDCRDAGVWDDTLTPDCRRRELDGGSRWAGCNVLRRSDAVGTQCIDAPSGVVMAGERLEDAL